MSVISSHLVAFPNPVNEKAARVVAGLVVVTAVAAPHAVRLAALAARSGLPAAGPVRRGSARSGSSRPRSSRRGSAPKLVPGPPKRFAQGLGLAFSLVAATSVTLGATTLGWALVVLLIAAALLESVFAFCLGCAIFGLLQRAGMIPESVCEACVVGSR